MKLKLLFAGYALSLVGVFLYSFTQIDLSLALSRNESLQEIVRLFQQIGYFQRPLSTFIYILLLLLLFGFYITFLWFAHRKKMSEKYAWSLVIAAIILLTFSYNAFSYDLFNYIFDAKIVTNYGQNPYIHKALDFSTDPMLSFMRWTHRVFPYGPVWLGITVPLSFVGFGYFIPTFLLFKLLMSASYFGSVYLIGKIIESLAHEKKIFGIIFFGLSPLILIEALVSAHIDIVMTVFALGALYYLIQKKYIFSYIGLIISIGIKFVTGFLLPLFIFIHIMQKKKKDIQWGFYFTCILLFLLVGTVIQTQQSGNFQPWYLILPLAFAVFIATRYYIIIPAIIISFAALINYVPYLYVGNWDKPIPQMLYDINLLSYSLAFFITTAVFFYRQLMFARRVKEDKKKHR